VTKTEDNQIPTVHQEPRSAQYYPGHRKQYCTSQPPNWTWNFLHIMNAVNNTTPSALPKSLSPNSQTLQLLQITWNVITAMELSVCCMY
jgi:hypothetical protein